MARNLEAMPPAALFDHVIRLLRARDSAAAQWLPRLEQHMNYAPGWLALGEVMEAAQEPGAARLAYQRAAAAPAAASPVLHRAGQGLARLGFVEAAADSFRRVLAADPASSAAWYSLGLALQDLRNFPMAAEAFREAIRLRPDFHEAALNAGIAWQEAGEMEAALDAYAASYRLRPESFGRIAQALIAAPCGRLYLRPSALRTVLMARA